jgi:two-component system NarL family sensor kinase
VTNAVEVDEPSHRATVVRAVAAFTGAGLIAMAILGLALAIASRRVGEREAIVDVRTQALIRAQSFVEPALTDGLVRSDAASRARVDAAVRGRVLDASLIRVKIWSPDGVILYSDEPRLIGSRYKLGADEVAALNRGLIEAGVSDLTQPENRYERAQKKLLEVYLPVRQPDGTRLLFEAYFRYAAVSASGSRIWRSFAPISLGALVALEVVQVPLAWSLARRLRQRQRERERLLRGAVESSDVERRRIAADLHDGVVQDLAGVAFALSGAARDPSGAPSAAVLEQASADVRESIRSLRSLLVEIYPPNLFDEGLEAALSDLAAKVSSRGVTATLDVSQANIGAVARPDVALIYRVAQEALRNVVAHAHAGHVDITLATRANATVLDVADDGDGFDPTATHDATRIGHFGLRGLADLVADAGGSLEIDSAPGRGTRVRVEVANR